MKTCFYAGTDIKSIMESLPKEESEHMHRVGILVGIIASKLFDLDNCSKYPGRSEFKYYGEAAAYHDIGKAWVPKSILTKLGRLTREETAIIYKHPLFARKLFDQINDGTVSEMPRHLTRLAFDSAVHHHEWWNGKGYPYGLKSENIPLVARITSVCDAYDAITGPRIYRKANTHFYACRELEANAGTQFDPMLIQVFLDNEREVSIFRREMISC
ncbi:MAG: HD domain-containing phosphohydrolase [Dehalobacterium sp.]